MPALPVVTESELRVPDLDPRHDGLRIAHLSDIHVGRSTPRAHVRAAIELANAANPDLIVMTGDYVCWRREEVPMAQEQLAGLRARRVVCVLGNHVYFTSGRGVAAALRDNGYDVLRNQHTVVDVDGAPLTFVGIDDPITRHDDAGAAFEGVSREGTRVVLTHYPARHGGDLDAAGAELAARGGDVVLCGHTHGGQINVPRITHALMDRVGLKFRRGHYDLGARARLYVTPGVGFSGPRVRAGKGTAAEVAVHTLRAA
jgi:predicted MPP superfamily phosphohydrolase